MATLAMLSIRDVREGQVAIPTRRKGQGEPLPTDWNVARSPGLVLRRNSWGKVEDVGSRHRFCRTGQRATR